MSNNLIPLSQAVKRLGEEGIPIPYHTLYHWVKRGIWIIPKEPISIGTQAGKKWFLYEDKLQEIIHAIRDGKTIHLQSNADPNKKETRGRKAGTRFGSYSKKKKTSSTSGGGKSTLSDGVLCSERGLEWKC